MTCIATELATYSFHVVSLFLFLQSLFVFVLPGPLSKKYQTQLMKIRTNFGYEDGMVTLAIKLKILQ